MAFFDISTYRVLKPGIFLPTKINELQISAPRVEIVKPQMRQYWIECPNNLYIVFTCMMFITIHINNKNRWSQYIASLSWQPNLKVNKCGQNQRVALTSRFHPHVFFLKFHAYSTLIQFPFSFYLQSPEIAAEMLLLSRVTLLWNCQCSLLNCSSIGIKLLSFLSLCILTNNFNLVNTPHNIILDFFEVCLKDKLLAGTQSLFLPCLLSQFSKQCHKKVFAALWFTLDGFV